MIQILHKIRPALSWNYLLAKIHPELPGQLLRFRRQSKLADRLVEEQRPDIVILPEDNIAYATAALIRAAHKRDIPAVIVPFTIANALELAEAYWHNPDYGMLPWINRFPAFLFPKWVYVHKDRRILPVRGAQIFAMELFRLAPPLPWIINSGDAGAIAVESESMRRYYLEAGLKESKLVLTGALSDDILARNKADAVARRAELYRGLGLPPERPLILCALPPDQFRAGREGCDFSTYDELMDFWLQTLAGIKDCNVILKLHPRMRAEEFAHLERPAVKIAHWDTAEIVPLCDIYVASVSATIRWAVACAKPTVNYDVYRFRYRDFVDVKGVLTIEEKADFVNTLSRLSQDTKYYREISEAMKLQAPAWANLDGQSGNRMLALFDSMIEKQHGKKAH